MQSKFTKKIFEDWTQKTISEADTEEIEYNLAEYFYILVGWLESSNNKKKEKNNG